MRRKTNLFYNTGADSKFLTFSSYTDSLTGSFLSTNTKLFPSAFLCLNIPKLLDEENFDILKKDFIDNYLICRYENKLAVLKDNIENESYIYPLRYLLEYIMQFDSSTTIPYIGNITEQDYNGIFADTICIINSSYIHKCELEYAENIDAKYIESYTDKLYGWWADNGYVGPKAYENTLAIFDTGTSYQYTSMISNIKYMVDSENNKMSFNVIIPLYTVMNTSEYSGNYIEIDNSESGILDDNIFRNVPFGIWISEHPVTLYKDNQYGQSWSLTIASQFKPFPASKYTEFDGNTEINSSAAFNTFSQVLFRQNKLLDTINVLDKRVTELTNEIRNIQNTPNITVDGSTLIIKQ